MIPKKCFLNGGVVGHSIEKCAPSKEEADDSVVNAVHQEVPFFGQMMHSGFSLHSNPL